MDIGNMIKRNNEIEEKTIENRFGGDGSIILKRLMTDGGKSFSRITLKPGCSIGYHTHTGDMEIYHVLTGNGEYNDNGVVYQIGPGDSTFTFSGEAHSLKNNTNEILEIMALILPN